MYVESDFVLEEAGEESLDIDQKVSNMETTRFYLQFYNNLHGFYFDTKFEKKAFLFLIDSCSIV